MAVFANRLPKILRPLANICVSANGRIKFRVPLAPEGVFANGNVNYLF